MIDRYDHRGRLLDGPDDDDPWCARHDQEADSCVECIAEFQREEAAFAAWRATQPAPSAGDLSDLPL